MLERPSEQTDTVDVSRMEHLLGLLGDLSQRDPSPALRERLELLSSARLGEKPGSGERLGRLPSGPLTWLRPACVIALLIVIGFTAVFVAHRSHREGLRDRMNTRVNPAAAPLSNEFQVAPSTSSSQAVLPTIRHPRPRPAHNTNSQRMTAPLPYSNGAIVTGTDATIRVSISQSELLSLGFPVNATLHDRRVVAELTLGDDGLPRAISVSLPLEVIKERK